MKTAFIALRALAFVTGFVLLWGWVALGLRPYDRRLAMALPGWMEIPGVALMAVGAILVLLCVGLFVARGQGTPAVFDPPRRFVAVGPYRHVRNPMYLGGLALLMGFGLYQSSIAILLLTLFLFFVVHLFVVFFEEPGLQRRYGAPYDEYCKAVLRWIPKY